MAEPTRTALGRVVGALIPHRRVYVRTERDTRFASLCPLSQIGIGVVLAGTVAWSVFATVAYVETALDADNASVRIAAIEDAHRALSRQQADRIAALEGELAEAERDAGMLADRLAERQRQFIDLSSRMKESESEVVALRAEFDRVQVERQRERAELQRLADETVALKLALADASTTREGLDQTLATFTAAMGDVIADRDAASRAAAEQSERVALLEGELGDRRLRQERLLAELSEAAKVGLSGLEKVFDRSDIDIERILREAESENPGEGGPFLPLPEDAAEWAPDTTDERMAALVTDLERVNLLRYAAERMPFGRPVEGGELSSNFGPRRDPLRRRVSMHSGIDIRGSRGTPIHSTADGVVVFAGRQSGYGIMVKIRHAFGFETLYAHLSQARVRVGERVGRGERVGDMGSTGRSTGTHLHYEVRIDQEPVNPIRFIEAARDVL